MSARQPGPTTPAIRFPTRSTTSAFPVACMARLRVTMPLGNRMSYARKSPSLRPATQSDAVALDGTWWVRFQDCAESTGLMGSFGHFSSTGARQTQGPANRTHAEPRRTLAPLPNVGVIALGVATVAAPVSRRFVSAQTTIQGRID